MSSASLTIHILFLIVPSSNEIASSSDLYCCLKLCCGRGQKQAVLGDCSRRSLWFSLLLSTINVSLLPSSCSSGSQFIKSDREVVDSLGSNVWERGSLFITLLLSLNLYLVGKRFDRDLHILPIPSLQIMRTDFFPLYFRKQK